MRTRQKVQLSGYKPLFERLYSMGVDTRWERYEKSLPQNRLASTGFFCHSVCLDGPCHVDPFGGSPKTGICGRTAKDMAASWLCTTAARGFVRRLREAAKIGADTKVEIPHEVHDLTEMTALPKLDSDKVDRGIREAALAAAAIEASVGPGTLPLQAGEAKCGLGARNRLRPAVLFDGLDCETMKSLCDKFASTGIDCVITGDERTGFGSGLPVLCPSSLASVVSVAGAVDAVIFGDRSYMKEGICYQVPGCAEVHSSANLHVCDVVAAARRHFNEFPPVPATCSKAAWENVNLPEGNVLVLAGGLGMKKTCGELTVSMARVAMDSGFEVVAFGDAAATLGDAGLMDPSGGAFARPWDNPAGLGLVMALVKEQQFKSMPVVAFPEAITSTDIAAALETAALGMPTYFGSPMPIDGPGLPEVLGWNGGDGLPLLCASGDDTPRGVLQKLVSMRRVVS